MSFNRAKTVLVTGASGYVASALIAHLAETGFEVDAIDLRSIDPRVGRRCRSFALIDINEPGQVADLGSGHWDVVIHLAALVDAAESLRSPEPYLRTNWRATETLLQELVCQRFILVSSAAARHPESSPYAFSKRKAEEALRRLKPSNGNVVRLHNVVGSSGTQHSNSPKAMFARLATAAERGEFVVNGADYPDSPDGSCVRSLIHVEDVAQSLVNLLERPQEEHGPEPVEIAYAEPFTVLQFAKAFRGINKLGFEIKTGRRRAGDIPVCRIERPGSFLATSFASIDALVRH